MCQQSHPCSRCHLGSFKRQRDLITEMASKTQVTPLSSLFERPRVCHRRSHHTVSARTDVDASSRTRIHVCVARCACRARVPFSRRSTLRAPPFWLHTMIRGGPPAKNSSKGCTHTHHQHSHGHRAQSSKNPSESHHALSPSAAVR